MNVHGWSLVQELVKCGKKTCKTCPHGPYWYRYREERGRVRKVYIGKLLGSWDPNSRENGGHGTPEQNRDQVEEERRERAAASRRAAEELIRENERILREAEERRRREAEAHHAETERRRRREEEARARQGRSRSHPWDAIFNDATASVALAVEILGITNRLEAREAKRALRRRVMEIHPDRGGSMQECKHVNAAYSYLCRVKGYGK